MTVRSSGVGTKLLMQKQFDSLQDCHSGAWYLVLATATMFGIILDTITTAFVACVCFSFIGIDNNSA